MLSFGALNAKSTDDTSFAVFHEVQKEEQEAAALLLYNEAIAHENTDNKELLVEKLLEVLNTELIKEAPESLKEGEVLAEHPALFLKYNVLKKLATTYEKCENNEKTIEYYLEAAIVDESDVAAWWKLGCIAMETLNLRLARFAFEKGLIYSSSHWPCLDNLISILYIVGDYAACLEMITKAFELDEQYIKGFAFRDQIFKEEAHFKKDFMQLCHLFTEDEERDETRYQEFVEEALIIRGKRKLLARREELSKIKVSKPLSSYSWFSLGEILLQTYTEQIEGKEYQPLSLGIDLSRYCRTPEQQASLPVPSPDVLAKKYNKSSYRDSESAKLLKRKKLNMTASEKESESQPKRRSTRVKLSKTKENDVNWNDLVYSYLPMDFKPTTAMDTDSQDSQESLPETIVKEKVQMTSGGTEHLQKESIAVSNFINSHAKSFNCITLMEEFLMTLTEHWNTKWRHGLSSLFLTMYTKYRKHTCLPNVLCPDVDQKYLAKLGKVILIALELQLDGWVHLKGGCVTSPSMSPFKSGTTTSSQVSLEKGEALKFMSDLHYISMLAANNDELLDDTKEYSIRYFYLHGRFMMQDNRSHAVNSLYNCIDALSSSPMDCVNLHNCQVESTISKETVEKIIDSLQQSQSLDELQRIFDEKKYVEIISLLEGPLIMQKNKLQEDSTQPERPSQMFILLESFFYTTKYKKCLKCIDIVLKESLSSSIIVEVWKIHLNSVLKRLESYFTNEKAKECLSTEYVQRLCDKLVKIMEITMDCDQSDDSITTLPWLLLYRIMKWQENLSSATRTNKDNEMEIINVEESCRTTDQEESNESVDENAMLDFMRNAHEYLGKKHWCCHDDGILLQEFVKGSFEALKNVKVQHQREALMRDLEQSFFCLYGNPCKKSKTKSLLEHNVQPIPLTWDNSQVLYDFYKPDGLPQLDLKTHTITVEVQHVLRKIVTVVPQQEIEIIPFDTLQQYIDGGDHLPVFPDDTSPQKKNSMEDLFYYLGDFYFKNKEFSKALKFYMHDVCVKPNRFQSWAAMALTRGSRLDEKLNQCELKSDGLMKKLITSTLRCFEKAVNINNKKCLILEEYGQTAYMLNSYASRKLEEAIENEKVDTSLCDHYKSMKRDMLLLTEKCFNNALQVATSKEGEQWLHYYMLGKTAEKLQKPPDVFLEHYQKSLNELYLSGGHFLKKITYRCPPEYSIEAVELFYRIHASILKLLKYSDGLDYKLFEEHLKRATQQEIYLEILEADQACLKENDSNTLSSKAPANKNTSTSMEGCQPNGNQKTNPIEQLLEELLSKVCFDGDNEKQNNSRTIPPHDQASDEFVIKEIVMKLIESVAEDCCVEIVSKDDVTTNTVTKDSITDDTVAEENVTKEIVAKETVPKDIINDYSVPDTLNVIKSELKSVSPEAELSTENLTRKHETVAEPTVIKLEVGGLEQISSSGEIKSTTNAVKSTTVAKIDDISLLSKSTQARHNSSVLPTEAIYSHGNTIKNKHDGVGDVESSGTDTSISQQDLHDVELSASTFNVVVIKGNKPEDRNLSQKCAMSDVMSASSGQHEDEQDSSFCGELKDEDVMTTLLDDLISLVEKNIEKNEKIPPISVAAKESSDLKEIRRPMTTVQKTDVDIIRECLEDLVTGVCKSFGTKTKRKHQQMAAPSSGKKLRTTSPPRDVSAQPIKTLQQQLFLERTFKSPVEENAFKSVAEKCLEAFGFCLRRFPEHYKSQYTMAFFLAHSALFKNLHWSRDLLLGNTTEQVKYRIPLPTHGVFSGRKKTNLFQYLWRIPVNEIDRPGSFCTHNYQSIDLLLFVLYELEDHALLIHVSAFLHKTPDKERKYLRDNDRALLAIKAFDLVLDILKKQMHQIVSKESASKFLMDVYEAYKHAQKLQISQQTTEYYLLKVYTTMKEYEQERDIARTFSLDEALKFCQQPKLTSVQCKF